MFRPPPDQSRFRWTLTGGAVSALVLCAAMVFGMAFLVLHEINALSSARSDNVQWTLAQSNVEFLRLQLAAVEAERAPTPEALSQMRRRFDVFYSRITTLEKGEVYRPLQQDSSFQQAYLAVNGFLRATASAMDAPDDALRAQLPAIVATIGDITGPVHVLGLSGLNIFAELHDTRREQLTQKLLIMGGVLFALFVGLVLLALALFRIARVAEARAKEIERTATRMRTIVETSPDALIVTDADGMIRGYNSAAQKIFGHTAEAAVGRNAIDLLFPADAAAELRGARLGLVQQTRTTDQGDRRFELSAIDSSGRRFPAELSVGWTRIDGTRVFVVYVRDISRRKAAEENLTEARDRALAGERTKAEFLAVMSHEMRTPLNGLLGSMQLMRDQALTERQAGLLGRMETSGRLLLSLVNDVLDLAKFEAGKMHEDPRPFSFAKLLDSVVETTQPMAMDNHDTLAWRWVGEPAEAAVGDVRRLRQILLNLACNAVKFTRNGAVDIEVELIGPDRSLAEFRVIDTGIGIAPENIDRIFNDFETLDSSYARQAGGTGLGLGIVRRLVTLLGGEIGVESEPGEGSLFWLRVPLAPLGAGIEWPGAAPVSLASAVGRPLRLLLVEDNEINRLIAREMLEGEGHHVTEATDGGIAVEWAAAETFDAILMDISMPVMDGPEAARRIRAGAGASAKAPIVAVTAHALPEDLARFRAAGMDHCISKPVDRQDLLRVLAAVTAGPTAPSAPEPLAEPAGGDLLALDQLRVLRATIPQENARLLDRFVADAEEQIVWLSTAAPDAPDLQAVTHRCAGTCATFGLHALGQALGAIETRLKRGEPVAERDLAALAPLWQASHAALERWRLAD